MEGMKLKVWPHMKKLTSFTTSPSLGCASCLCEKPCLLCQMQHQHVVTAFIWASLELRECRGEIKAQRHLLFFKGWARWSVPLPTWAVPWFWSQLGFDCRLAKKHSLCQIRTLILLLYLTTTGIQGRIALVTRYPRSYPPLWFRVQLPELIYSSLSLYLPG